jgi:hypothetical protein
LETRSAKRSRRCRFAHLFAKACIFKFCVGVLKKNTNTEVARDKQRQELFATCGAPLWQLNLLRKRFYFLRLPRVVARLEAQHGKPIFDLS